MKAIKRNTQKRNTHAKNTTKLLSFLVAMLMGQSVLALEALDDSALAEKTGRETGFLTIQNIGTGDFGNPNPNVAFTRLTMNAKMELNTNMRKLRLGCDDANLNNCDISIDNLSMTGIVPHSPDGYPKGTQPLDTKLNYTKNQLSVITNPANAGPTTDFVMNKPFIEVAIQNPNSLTDRKLVGYRFGAHEVWGMMSTGDGPVQGNTRNPEFPGQPVDATELSRHTGINSISGRLAQRLDNGHVQTSKLAARAAIVAGNLERDINSGVDSFGRNRRNYNTILSVATSGYTAKDGYLRNTWLGDSDTVYNPATYGPYVGNSSTYEAYRQERWTGIGSPYCNIIRRNCMVSDDKPLVGRAIEFKRADTVELTNMVTRIHNAANSGNFLELGDLFANQKMKLKLVHQLQLGNDWNNNYKYDKGEGVDHMAFQYQTLDGLQWITTDKRFGDRYDRNGRVVPGTEKAKNGGYDWLSTRAGWWLEQPMSTIRDFWIPQGQVAVPNHETDKGLVPNQDHSVSLGDLDLGKRAVDNCYGNLTFC